MPQIPKVVPVKAMRWGRLFFTSFTRPGILVVRLFLTYATAAVQLHRWALSACAVCQRQRWRLDRARGVLAELRLRGRAQWSSGGALGTVWGCLRPCWLRT